MSKTNKVDLQEVLDYKDDLITLIDQFRTAVEKFSVNGDFSANLKGAWTGTAADAFESKVMEKLGELNSRASNLDKFVDYLEDYRKKVNNYDYHSGI